MKTKTLIFFIVILSFGNCVFSQTLTGTWVLTYVAPVDAMDSEPRGVTNVRFHFTEDGKLFYLLPDDSLTDNVEYVHYSFNEDTLTIMPEGEDSIQLKLSFTDSDTFKFSRDFAPVRIYKKIQDSSSALLPIEPLSLQLINIGDTADYTCRYDTNDYSLLPFPGKLKGNWEVIAYENITRGDMPPYGFLNDIWKFTDDSINVFNRMDQKDVNVKYSLAGSNIIVTTGDGSEQVVKAEFNRWGHLVLDTGNEIIKLKLISKDTAVASQMPLKVVLLKLKGED